MTLTDIFSHHKSKKDQPDVLSITSPEELGNRLIKEIQRLQESYEHSAKRMKSVDDEKNKLLSILDRKEERYIGVITEKDTIIENYEQALWAMENGQIIEEGPLAHRISYIMQIFMRSSREDESIAEEPKKKKKKKKKEEEEEKEERECVIY